MRESRNRVDGQKKKKKIQRKRKKQNQKLRTGARNGKHLKYGKY